MCRLMAEGSLYLARYLMRLYGRKPVERSQARENAEWMAAPAMNGGHSYPKDSCEPLEGTHGEARQVWVVSSGVDGRRAGGIVRQQMRT